MNTIDSNDTPKRRLEDHQPAAKIDWAAPGAPAVPAAPDTPRATPLRAVASMSVNADGVSAFPTPAAKDLAHGHYMLAAPGAAQPQAAVVPSCDQIIKASGDILLRGAQPGEIEYDVALVAELARQQSATITNEQITAGAAIVGDDGKPVGRNTAIMVWDAMGGKQAAPAAIPEGEFDADRLRVIANDLEDAHTSAVLAGEDVGDEERAHDLTFARNTMVSAKFALREYAARLGASPVAPEQDQAIAEAWVSVRDELPSKYCLAVYETSRGVRRIIRAMHVKQYEIEATGDECDSEINDANDTEYLREGWYELIDNWGDYSSVKVCEGVVTHWMPLPPMPGESAPAGAARQGDATQAESATPAAHIASAELLSEADILDALGTITEGTPKRLPPGWAKFARAIARKVAAHIASKPNAEPADLQKIREYAAVGKEFLDKTEWVQKEIDTFPIQSLGHHPADVMTDEIRRLRTLAATPAASAPTVPERYVLMPKRLTAENGAKSLFIGEFREQINVPCPECNGDEECTECGGDGYVEQGVMVEWDTIKRIYDLAVEKLAAAPSASADAVIEAREQALEEAAEKLERQHAWISNVAAANLIRTLNRTKAAGAEGAK